MGSVNIKVSKVEKVLLSHNLYCGKDTITLDPVIN